MVDRAASTSSPEARPPGGPRPAAPPEPELGSPLYADRGLVRDASAELRDLVRYRELVRYMVSSSLKLDTARTVLGSVWWLLDPLLLMAVYVVFVDVILQRGGENYALFVLVAVIAWKHLSSGCGRAMANTVRHQELMKQVRFPRAVLPLSAVLAVSVHFLVGLVVLVGAAAAFGAYPSPALPLLLPLAAIQLVLTLGLGFLFAAVNFFFRDLQGMVAYVLSLWFFLSPALYPLSSVPDHLLPLYDVNPFTHLLGAYRAIVMDGRVPDLAPLGVVAAASLVVLVLGYVVFVRLERNFTKVA